MLTRIRFATPPSSSNSSNSPGSAHSGVLFRAPNKSRNLSRAPRRRNRGKPGKAKNSHLNTDFISVRSGALLRGPSQRTVTMTKWGPQSVITQAPVDNITRFTFQVSDLLENGAFLILYSEYRIRMVEVCFRPMFRANSVALQTAVAIPLIYVVYEPTSSTSLSFAELIRFAGLVQQDDSKSFVVKCSPRIAIPVFDGIITSAYSVGSRDTWLQTEQLSIPHYGLFVGVSGSGNVAGPFQEWNVSIRYTLEFRIER